MIIQKLNIKLEDGSCREFSIDKSEDKYMLTLTDSNYSGKPPVFETAEDAFLFMLKIMSWIPSSIAKIETTCEFLSQEQIVKMCDFDVEVERC